MSDHSLPKADRSTVPRRRSPSVSSREDLGYYSDKPDFSIGSADFADLEEPPQSFVDGKDILRMLHQSQIFIGTQSQFHVEENVRRSTFEPQLPSNVQSIDCVFVGTQINLYLS